MLDTSDYVSPGKTRFPEWQRAVGDKIEFILKNMEIDMKSVTFAQMFAQTIADDPAAEARSSFFTWLAGQITGRFSAADVADLLANPVKPEDAWMSTSKLDAWNDKKAEVANRKAEFETGAGGAALGYNPSPVAVGNKLRSLADKPMRVDIDGKSTVVRLVRTANIAGRDRGFLWELQRMEPAAGAAAEAVGAVDIEDGGERAPPRSHKKDFEARMAASGVVFKKPKMIPEEDLF